MYEEYNERKEFEGYEDLLGELYSHSTLEQEANDRGDYLYNDLSGENDAITEIVETIEMFPIGRQNHLLNAVYERLKYSRKVSLKETKKALKEML